MLLAAILSSCLKAYQGGHVVQRTASQPDPAPTQPGVVLSQALLAPCFVGEGEIFGPCWYQGSHDVRRHQKGGKTLQSRTREVKGAIFCFQWPFDMQIFLSLNGAWACISGMRWRNSPLRNFPRGDNPCTKISPFLCLYFLYF